MKNLGRKLFVVTILLILTLALAIPVFADVVDAGAGEPVAVEAVNSEEAIASQLAGDKAIAAGIAITASAGLGALGMGIATGKALEGISRQPEVEGKIRTMFMLGLVFIETAIIYALLVVILIIFVI
jgi:F-type H+-transporting ATPase subunit c